MLSAVRANGNLMLSGMDRELRESPEEICGNGDQHNNRNDSGAARRLHRGPLYATALGPVNVLSLPLALSATPAIDRVDIKAPF